MLPRIEQKLAIPLIDYVYLVRWLSSQGASLLYPSRRVSSTYFDTPQLSMLNDTVEGIVPRRKVRVRCYGIHGPQCESRHQLETKLTTESGRKKKISAVQSVHQAERDGLMDDQYGWLSAVISITYEREYFAVSGIRMTVDRNIRYQAFQTCSRAWSGDEQMAVEVKAPSTTSLDWLNNEFPFPRIHFSKYERGMLQTVATVAGDR